MLFKNQVILLGNIGQTVEARKTSSGKLCAQFHLATTKKFQKNGEWVEKTTWHNIVAWDKVAEIFDGIGGGSKVYIEGELQTRTFEDNGEKKYLTEVSVQEFYFVDRKNA